MQPKLILLDEKKPDWKLDEQTKEAGRRGIEMAREALRQARTHRPTAA
jgi:hypothetical protein